MEKLKIDTILLKFKKTIEIDQWGQLKFSKILTLGLIIIGLTAYGVQFRKNDSKVISVEAPLIMDTFIPEGMSLVPIKVSNYESLDQIIGQFGVVDLLTTPLSAEKKPRRVAYAVKIIRAPRNPSHFSVLVPSDKVHKLVGYHGEFTVSVRNPKLLGTKFVKEKNKSPKGRIYYD